MGLVTEERTGPDDSDPDLTCHELVRARIRAWMLDHPQDRDDLTENILRLAYAERLEAVFNELQHQNMSMDLEAGSRALVYCVQAGAWERLGDFAGRLVTSIHDPYLLAELLPHLELAADSAPEGKPRWSGLCYLADALRNAGRPDTSLPFYEQAATQSRAAAEAGGEMACEAWADVVAITGNWANALATVGDLDNACRRHLESAEASKKAGRPAVNVIGSELEAVRIDIEQGRAAQALPEGDPAGAGRDLVAAAPVRPACAGGARSRDPRPRAHQRAGRRNAGPLCTGGLGICAASHRCHPGGPTGAGTPGGGHRRLSDEPRQRA